MSNTFFGVAIDCADAATLAEFWAAVLGRRVAAGRAANPPRSRSTRGRGPHPDSGSIVCPSPRPSRTGFISI
jgi:Glyoxalase-like domain